MVFWNCLGSPTVGSEADAAERKAAKARNAAIEKQIERDSLIAKHQVKLLLLGAGESGKSTVLRQFRLIYGPRMDATERQRYLPVIHENTLLSMQSILIAMRGMGLSLTSEISRICARIVLAIGKPPSLEYRTAAHDETLTRYSFAKTETNLDYWTRDLVEALQTLWVDDGVRSAWLRRNEFQVIDSAEYFFQRLDRLRDPSFIPSEQDILYSRQISTGILETSFTVGRLRYDITDVGGQRSQRRKWLFCFQNVNVLIFVLSISEYDQALLEDATVSRMAESMLLFDAVINSKWFRRTACILFANKTDLFKEKIKRVPLKSYFTAYRGPDTYQDGVKYICDQFRGLYRSDFKPLFVHLTCATDTTQMSTVLHALSESVLQASLESLGML